MSQRKYAVRLSTAAVRDMRALPLAVEGRIEAKISALAEDPRPPGCRKMEGSANRYRVRVGDYRIVYAIEDKVLLVLVIRVGHRREVYRGR